MIPLFIHLGIYHNDMGCFPCLSEIMNVGAGCGGESGDGGGAKEFACSGLGPEIANA